MQRVTSTLPVPHLLYLLRSVNPLLFPSAKEALHTKSIRQQTAETSGSSIYTLPSQRTWCPSAPLNPSAPQGTDQQHRRAPCHHSKVTHQATHTGYILKTWIYSTAEHRYNVICSIRVKLVIMPSLLICPALFSWGLCGSSRSCSKTFRPLHDVNYSRTMAGNTMQYTQMWENRQRRPLKLSLEFKVTSPAVLFCPIKSSKYFCQFTNSIIRTNHPRSCDTNSNILKNPWLTPVKQKTKEVMQQNRKKEKFSKGRLCIHQMMSLVICFIIHHNQISITAGKANELSN